MNTDFWNQRYSTPEYIYGKEANLYFKEKLSLIKPGKILLPAEGEGRQAIYAASLGWQVDAFDQSPVARDKALTLAKEKNLVNPKNLNYIIAKIEEFSPQEKYYDVVGLFFVHLPPSLRQNFHQNLLKSIKTGGYVILQGFGKSQLQYNSGGPKDLDWLFSKEEILQDFSELKILEIKDEISELNEGPAHKGFAHLISFFGQKINSDK